jgi:hypothetical protein
VGWLPVVTPAGESRQQAAPCGHGCGASVPDSGILIVISNARGLPCG